jgi:DNA gyrase subunit B/topoisomerase-4 subunit B
MNRPLSLAPKLSDCDVHGPGSGAELFVVEGDSAASAVVAVRDPRLQAVLAMQGKPLNAVRATDRRVAAHPFYRALTAALGTGWGAACDPARLRYERLVLLTDPDADGIHCGALVLMFLHRWLSTLLVRGRVQVVRAPVGVVEPADGGPRVHAFAEPQFQAECAAGRQRDGGAFRALRYRGLASLDPQDLSRLCVAPATRNARTLTAADAEHAIDVFGARAAVSPQQALL